MWKLEKFGEGRLGGLYDIKEIAKKLLIRDCIELSNAIFYISEKDRPVFMLASTPYICLVANEAYEWCRKAKISLTTFESKEHLENIRAKAKLFGNDTIVSFNEQRLMIESIIRTEHAYYKKLAKPYCPDFLIDDVGTYMLNNTYIGNTIQYAYDFHLFSKPNKSIYDSGYEIKSFSSEIGSILQEIITILSGTSYRIPQGVNISQLHINRDFNFKRKFKQIDNILIFSLACRINFLLHCFKKNCPQDSMLYLRLIYITFYSSRNELQNLKIDCDHIFDGYFDRVFRNCMAHYSLYQKVADNEIKPTTTGYGVIEKFFDVDYIELVNTIESKLTLILSALERHYKS